MRSQREFGRRYTLPRINQLELALLKALNFNVKVPASEYAKYYFSDLLDAYQERSAENGRET
jgi:hypothetical protein